MSAPRKSQAELVEEYLTDGAGRSAGISGLEALSKFGVIHLPSVMFKIGKTKTVRSEFETKEGGPNGTKSFKRYWIVPKATPPPPEEFKLEMQS